MTIFSISSMAVHWTHRWASRRQVKRQSCHFQQKLPMLVHSTPGFIKFPTTISIGEVLSRWDHLLKQIWFGGKHWHSWQEPAVAWIRGIETSEIQSHFINHQRELVHSQHIRVHQHMFMCCRKPLSKILVCLEVHFSSSWQMTTHPKSSKWSQVKLPSYLTSTSNLVSDLLMGTYSTPSQSICFGPSCYLYGSLTREYTVFQNQTLRSVTLHVNCISQY